VLARCSATQDISQRGGLQAADTAATEKRKGATVCSPKREMPLSPEWSTLRKKGEDAVSEAERPSLTWTSSCDLLT